jgi:hypothetical protein
MGSRFTFCLTADDTAEYQRRLERAGDLVILAGISDQSGPRRWPELPVRDMGKEVLQLFLTQEAYVRDVVWYHVPTRNAWALDLLRSPVVEFSRAYYLDDVIRAGRAFFDSGYYDDTGRWQVKAGEFLKWAKLLLATGKRLCKRDPETGVYWGPEAAALRDRSELKLVHS